MQNAEPSSRTLLVPPSDRRSAVDSDLAGAMHISPRPSQPSPPRKPRLRLDPALGVCAAGAAVSVLPALTLA